MAKQAKKSAEKSLSEQPDGEAQRILREAQERFRRCEEWEGYARSLFVDDLKFANADSDNKYQWTKELYDERSKDLRPSLTVNKTRQHNLNIINDAKMNKPSIKYRAAGNGATVESARILDGIARHIEYQSNAPAHYDIATTFQVEGGIGYLRVLTDYVSPESFDQDIFVQAVADPLTVYIDPDARAPAKEDMRFAFIFEDIPTEKFKQRYPKYAAYAGVEGFGGDKGWQDKDHVRVAEYFEVVEEADELLAFDGPNGEAITLLASQLRAADPKSKVFDDPMTRRRDVFRKVVKYHFLVGSRLVEEEEKIWPGDVIPIIPVVGEEVIIDGRMDRKGHTRALKDPQRMYNWWASSAVEYGALQTKTPWLVGVESVEGVEDYWRTANRINHAFLPYKAVGGDGQALPPPVRVEPPVPSPVALKGMEVAAMEMQMVSGQYENQMGQQGNERTGKAISERQRQGDRATYHFIDNLAIAVRQVGKIILDLIPKVYDTNRVITILAENGESMEVKLDPQAKQAHVMELNENNDVIGRILNPGIGQYEVLADVGPGYATRREEAFNALTLLLTQSPTLTGVIGDLMFRAGDFPMAEEAAERLKRMVPPQALGQGPSQNEQMLAMQVQQLQDALKATMWELQVEKGKMQARLEKREVDVYDAITKRIDVVGKQGLSALQLAKLQQDVVKESREVPISDTYEGHAAQGQLGIQQGNAAASFGNGASAAMPSGMETPLEDDEMPEGAFRGEDGHAYGPHPEMPGMLARITRQGQGR